jgi:hypothetical protein
MLDYWKASLPQLSDMDLFNLAKDAEARIGSHVAGGNTLDGYVQRQQALLELIQEEVSNRGNSYPVQK